MAIATSLTNGEVTRKANVILNGISPFTKPINKETDEQEQNGVIASNVEASKYSESKSLFRDKKFPTLPIVK